VNILAELTKKLAEACEDSIKYDVYGGQMFHIEKITRLPNDGPALMFEVTTWDELGDESRLVRNMSMIEMMDLLARLISEKAANEAVDLFRQMESESNERA
jgi:hypothetical protein